MNHKKSVFVTLLVAVMLAAILFGMHRMYPIVFSIMTGILAVYGFANGASNFCRWLGKEPVLLPAHVKSEEEIKIDTQTYDDILAEMMGEKVDG